MYRISHLHQSLEEFVSGLTASLHLMYYGPAALHDDPGKYVILFAF